MTTCFQAMWVATWQTDHPGPMLEHLLHQQVPTVMATTRSLITYTFTKLLLMPRFLLVDNHSIIYLTNSEIQINYIIKQTD